MEGVLDFEKVLSVCPICRIAGSSNSSGDMVNLLFTSIIYLLGYFGRRIQVDCRKRSPDKNAILKEENIGGKG
jgi:hypothetical protein